MSSTRLPGKVLMEICGEPMLIRQIERIGRSRKIDELVVATSTDETDNIIEKVCTEHGIKCFRGDLRDVLKRYYDAASQFRAQDIVRLTGDCPLSDAVLIDEIIQFYQDNKFDYASNTIEPTYPDGLDVEVFSFDVLEKAFNEAKLPSEREHVTPFIYNNPARFNLGNYINDTNLSAHRWTVDENSDFELVTKIYENLYPQKRDFSSNDVYSYLSAHPEVYKLNQTIERNAGMKKSLKNDFVKDKNTGGE